MKITVMGDGAWGLALAFVAAKAGHDVKIWSRKKPHLSEANATILAVPAQAVRDVLQFIKAPIIISAAKGIERSSGLTMAEVVKSVLPHAEFYALSGPSFATDVIGGLPTAVTLAGENLDATTKLASQLSLPNFRIYASDDVIGVELGGALKNILAIACGVADGRGLGESARASLITRGFAELSRFAKLRGAKTETLMGLSGLGDLLLTCSSEKSRNYAFGLALGQGASAEQALANSQGVVEGACSASIAAKMGLQFGVELPIINAVNSIIDGTSNPDEEIKKLLARPIGPELK
jgi:glycerol-3-phosphate dehydrogenase (NAD(P)+)